MSQAGIGAMLHYLGGGSKNDPAKYYGKVIEAAALNAADEKFRIIFTDGTIIDIWDDGQSCCESRYMRTDDQPESLVGGTLIRIEAKPGPEVEENYETHEQVFVEIATDKGFITLANHNEHNGYYGGFGLTITEPEVEDGRAA
jgi:hypothetical protein